MGYLDEKVKEIKEERSKEVATITAWDFMDASTKALTESEVCRGMIEENPLLILAFEEYTKVIYGKLFCKEEK